MNICVFGASTTWGAYDFEKGGWVERLKIYFFEKDDVNVFNLGVSGDTTESLLKRFDCEAEARKSAIIVFSIGVNDSAYIKTKDNPTTNLEDFSRNISELIKKAKKFTQKIIFVGPTKIDESKTMPVPWDSKRYYTNKNIALYGASMKYICDKEGIIFVDMLDLLDLTYLYNDGLHPNSGGHEKISERVKDVLRNIV